MSERQRDKYETLGVVKPVMSHRRHPVVVMINRNERTGDLSFQFGLLRRGHVDMVKYWREGAVMQMAMLAKAVAELSMGKQLAGIEFTSATLKKIIDDSPYLEWVEEFIPPGSRNGPKMTLGDRARKR
jgi:hypothetical protein